MKSICYISDSIVVADSRGMGRGVFAAADLKKNVVIEIAPVIVMNHSDRAFLDKTLLHDYIFEWGEKQDQCCMALGYVPLYNHSSSSTAGGTIKGTYDRSEKTYTYTLQWNGLSGNPTAIHFHGVADRGYAAIPIAPLAAYPNGIVQTFYGFKTSPSGTYNGTLYVDGSVIKEHDLLAGKFYVDIHTAAFPGGEIRGQIIFP